MEQREELQHLEFLERLCSVNTLSEINEYHTEFTRLTDWVKLQVAGCRQRPVPNILFDGQLVNKLFLATRVALDKTLESCQGGHFSQNLNIDWVLVLLEVCIMSLQPCRLPPCKAHQQIMEADFLPTYVAACSAVAASLSWHLQLVDGSATPCATTQRSRHTSSKGHRIIRRLRSAQARAAAATKFKLAVFGGHLITLYSLLIGLCGKQDGLSNSRPKFMTFESHMVVTMAPASALAVALLCYLSSGPNICSKADFIYQDITNIAYIVCYELEVDIHHAKRIGKWDDEACASVAAMKQALQSSGCQELFICILAAQAARMDQQQDKTAAQEQGQYLLPATLAFSTRCLLRALGVSEQVAERFAYHMSAVGAKVCPERYVYAAVANLECTITLSNKLFTTCTATGDSSGGINSSCKNPSMVHAALLDTLLYTVLQLPSNILSSSCVRCMEAVGSMYDCWISSDSFSSEQAAVVTAVSSNMIHPLVSTVGSAVLQALQQSTKTGEHSSADIAMQLSHIIKFFLSAVSRIEVEAAHEGGDMNLSIPAFDWPALLQQEPFMVLAAMEALARLTAADSTTIIPVVDAVRQVVQAAACNTEFLAAAEVSAGRSSFIRHVNGMRHVIIRKSLAARLISFKISCLKLMTKYIECKYDTMSALECAAQLAVSARTFGEVAAAAVAAREADSKCFAVLPWIHVAARALHCCSTALLWPHTGRAAAAAAAASDVEAWDHAVERGQAGLRTGWNKLVLSLQALSVDGDVSQVDACIEQQADLPSSQQPCTASDNNSPGDIANEEECCWSHREGRTSSELTTLLQGLSDSVAWCNAQVQQLISSNAESKSAAAVWPSEFCQQIQQQSEQLQQGLKTADDNWQAIVDEHLQQTDLPVTVKLGYSLMLQSAREALGYQVCLQLQQYSLDLCALLPTRLCCNNPECSNLGRSESCQRHMSELTCVGNRMCSGCKAAGYCSRECQEQHWSKHKVLCHRLCSVGKSSGK